MDEAHIRHLLLDKFPSSVVEVMRLSDDAFEVSVAASEFQGKKMLEQHRIVYQALQEKLDSNELHAVVLKTKILQK